MTARGTEDLARALEESSGTVTEFLESVAGEPVVAHKLRHDRVAAVAGNALDLPVGEPLADRAVVLEGRSSGRAFVYAESMLACGRLPEVVCRRLTSGDDPIGRVLSEEGVDVGREPLEAMVRPPAGLEHRLASELAASPLARSYRITVAGLAVIAINEWFLPAVVGQLPSGGPLTQVGDPAPDEGLS
jgi:chorismate-pyruvate lyase